MLPKWSQYNGNIVFDGIISCAKAALENGIPVVLGNDVGCPWITQYDFWRELYYFQKYVGVSNSFALYTATGRSAELAGIGDITGNDHARQVCGHDRNRGKSAGGSPLSASCADGRCARQYDPRSESKDQRDRKSRIG